MRVSLPLAVVLAALVLVVPGGFAGLPFVPPPEKIVKLWTGAAPGRAPGVLVIRDFTEWRRVTDGLDPAFAGTLPDFSHEHVLLVVGRERENPCRDTVLREVRRRGVGVEVVIEEHVPPEGCSCPGAALPPRAWLVRVPRAVTRARRSITDVVVACDEARAAGEREARRPVLLGEGSWDEMPGARLLVTEEQVTAVARRLRQDLPVPDFARERLVVVTGRPRSNGCRRTRVVEASVDGDTARFVVEEAYPARGEVCSTVFLPPAAFVYRVPAAVEKVEVETREVRRRSGR